LAGALWLIAGPLAGCANDNKALAPALRRRLCRPGRDALQVEIASALYLFPVAA